MAGNRDEWMTADRAGNGRWFGADDDGDAKRAAMTLASEIGFVAEDASGLANAKVLEDMVKVWLALMQTHGRGIGFAISLG